MVDGILSPRLIFAIGAGYHELVDVGGSGRCLVTLLDAFGTGGVAISLGIGI
jgi:hypothetical protein